jgi:hypothetical protein
VRVEVWRVRVEPAAHAGLGTGESLRDYGCLLISYYQEVDWDLGRCEEREWPVM